MKGLVYAIVGLAVIFNLGACGGGNSGNAGSSSSAASVTYLGTQTPGDVWRWTLNSDSFTAENKTTNYSYSGSKAVLSSGFLKLTITSTTDPGMTVPQVVYALEYPNTVLLVKNTNGVTTAVAEGHCPPGGVDYNWIQIPGKYWDVTKNSAYGIASSSISNNQYTYTGENIALDGTQLGPLMGMNSSNPPSFTCSNGIMSGINGSTTTMSATPSGMLMFDEGVDNGGGFGMLQPSANIDIAQLAAANYRGVMFKYTSGGQETQAGGAEPGTGPQAGNLVGFTYADVATGTRDNASSDAVLDMNTATQPSPGLIRFTLTEGGVAHDFVAVVNQIAGKYMFFGISTNTATNEPYNVFMVQQ